jgi:hypothetical protein
MRVSFAKYQSASSIMHRSLNRSAKGTYLTIWLLSDSICKREISLRVVDGTPSSSICNKIREKTFAFKVCILWARVPLNEWAAVQPTAYFLAANSPPIASFSRPQACPLSYRGLYTPFHRYLLQFSRAFRNFPATKTVLGKMVAGQI